MAEDVKLIMERAAAQAERWQATVQRQQEIITRLTEGVSVDLILGEAGQLVVEARLAQAAVERERDALLLAARGFPEGFAARGSAAPVVPVVADHEAAKAYGLRRKAPRG